MKFLIVGLGNIGAEYAHTRHNIGFDVANSFVQKHGGSFQVERYAYMAEIKWKGKSFIVICPTTYMNLSGKAVKYWADKEKIAPSHILVILDDLALPVESIRLRAGGSDAGHNGLKSINDSLQTQDYPRIRFGIGNNYRKGFQAAFVLGKWEKAETPIVAQKIDIVVEAIETFATQGLSAAMNKYNSKKVI